MNTFDSKLSEVKREQMMTKRSMLEDQSTKQILSQINEKLQRYKKVSYSKRDFLWQKTLSKLKLICIVWMFIYNFLVNNVLLK